MCVLHHISAAGFLTKQRLSRVNQSQDRGVLGAETQQMKPNLRIRRPARAEAVRSGVSTLSCR